MSDPQGLISYPGLSTFLSAEYTMSQGISPGICHVELPQELCGQLAARGDLTFRYADQSFTLFNCKLAGGHLAKARGGYLARVTLLDRRWQWRFGCISGHYNLRMAAGAPRGEGLDANAEGFSSNTAGTPRVRPGTEKTPQELATLCLQAMGETLFDVSALPNDARPQVDWSYANPAQALQSLCDELGCRVVLNLADNKVRIVRHGQGSPLPQNGWIEFASAGLRPGAPPGALLLVGGPSVFQGFLPLEAVGIDLDGSIRPIDALSYRPDGGWSGEPPQLWPRFTDPLTRALVEAHVYRLWRIALPIEVPSAEPVTVSDVRQICLFDRLLDASPDPLDPTKTTAKPVEVWGTFDAGLAQTKQTPSENRVMKSGFSIDADRWLVHTDGPLYVHDGAGYRPATLHLKAAYAVRDAQTWEPLRYTRARILDITSNSPPRVIARDELAVKSVGDFDDSFALTAFADNRIGEQLDQEADRQLDAAEAEYLPQASFDVPYAGLVPIDVDGLVQQVTYSIESGPNGGTRTRASLLCEHSPYVPGWNARRRLEQQSHAGTHAPRPGRDPSTWILPGF